MALATQRSLEGYAVCVMIATIGVLFVWKYGFFPIIKNFLDGAIGYSGLGNTGCPCDILNFGATLMDLKVLENTSVLKKLFFINLFFALFLVPLGSLAKHMEKNKNNFINISTCSDLQNMSANLSGQYILTTDIDCTGVDFSPIGNFSNGFSGSLDGANHKISNLSIAKSNTDYVGLFGYTYNASIQNIILDNIKIIGRNDVGSLIGWGSASVISNVKIEQGTVSDTGQYDVGGLIGVLDASSNPSGVSQCSSAVTVDAINAQEVGGLIGRIVAGVTVENSNATGNVTGSANVGGLIGIAYAPTLTIRNSYATGTVTSSENTGGLIGELFGTGVVDRCYATGNVTGNNKQGGLIGVIVSYGSNGGSIINSYATGAVSGATNFTGGLIGYNDLGTTFYVTNNYSTGAVRGNASVGGLIGGGSSNVTSSYWDMQTSGQPTSFGGTGRMTVEMYQQATYTGWDFTNVWNINELKSYPWLRTSGKEIQSCVELQAMSQNLNDNYKLVTDIDCTDISFLPVGTYQKPFTGSLDGNRHIIYNLTIKSDQPYIGLFGATQSARISDLALKNVNIQAQKSTGSLIGFAFGGTQIVNVSVYGLMEASIDADYLGGLVGVLSDGSIDRSLAAVTITAPSCHYVGGLVGQNHGQISNSYALGAVTASEIVGGLVGDNSGTIINTYSTGKVDGVNSVGGLIGSNSGSSVISSYWDTQTSGQLSSSGGVGKVTTDMYNQSTYVNWDFSSVWSILDLYTYPWLKNQVSQPKKR